jgi:aldehyde dehydrogenase (NAD+)
VYPDCGCAVAGCLLPHAQSAGPLRATWGTVPQNRGMQQHYIANAAVRSSSERTLPVIDPSDGQQYDTIQRGTPKTSTPRCSAARQCYEGVWSKLSAAERGRLLMRLSLKVAEHAEELAAIEQRDCGKPTKQARADAVALARYFEFYAGACDKLHGETLPYQDGYTVFTWREPHGVTGHVIPWNYPMQIFGRSVGGALAAGNVCVVKPSEDACLSLIRVAQLAAEVRLPGRRHQHRHRLRPRVGDALARHPGIDHISFTGSPTVGTLIQQAAAERHCPVTLELGGKSPQIVFADADLDAGAADGHQRHRAERRPDLLGRLAPAGGAGLYEPLLERLGEAFRQPARRPGGHGPGRRPADPPDASSSASGTSCRTRSTPASPWWPRARWSTRRRSPASTRPPRCCATCR